MRVTSASTLVLGGALFLLGCPQEPAKKNAEPETISIANGNGNAKEEEDTTTESGDEGDEDALPALTATPSSGSGGAAITAELVRMLSHVSETHYSHHTIVDENQGIYDFDCSGLADYALAKVAPDAYETLRAATVKRPLSKHIVSFLGALEPGAKRGRWRRVARADDLLAGDIIAWLKPPESTSHNTGHTMIVRGAPSRSGDEIGVPITDSTAQRHGGDDSRFASKATGIGTGTIYLIVNEAGVPTGYRWSHGRKARTHGTIVMLGRVE